MAGRWPTRCRGRAPATRGTRAGSRRAPAGRREPATTAARRAARRFRSPVVRRCCPRDSGSGRQRPWRACRSRRRLAASRPRAGVRAALRFPAPGSATSLRTRTARAALGERDREQADWDQGGQRHQRSRHRRATRRSKSSSPIAAPVANTARNSAATGLESAVSTASPAASPVRRRSSATTAPSAGSRPKANASRPVYRLVAVARPNTSAPSHAWGPKCRRASGSNSAAVPTAAIAAAS